MFLKISLALECLNVFEIQVLRTLYYLLLPSCLAGDAVVMVMFECLRPKENCFRWEPVRRPYLLSIKLEGKCPHFSALCGSDQLCRMLIVEYGLRLVDPVPCTLFFIPLVFD